MAMHRSAPEHTFGDISARYRAPRAGRWYQEGSRLAKSGERIVHAFRQPGFAAFEKWQAGARWGGLGGKGSHRLAHERSLAATTDLRNARKVPLQFVRQIESRFLHAIHYAIRQALGGARRRSIAQEAKIRTCAGSIPAMTFAPLGNPGSPLRCGISASSSVAPACMR